MITYQIRKVMGDLDKVADAWNAKITKKADTGETEINEEQEKLLVASETQIESSSRILSESRLSEQAQISRPSRHIRISSPIATMTE